MGRLKKHEIRRHIVRVFVRVAMRVSRQVYDDAKLYGLHKRSWSKWRDHYSGCTHLPALPEPLHPQL